MKRSLPLASLFAGLALAGLGSAGFAADLDYRRARRVRPTYPPVALDTHPIEPIYSRPVVGFYGYPYDHLVPPGRPPYGLGTPAAPEPYVLRRDQPHGIQSW